METSVPLEKLGNLRNDEGGGNNDGQMKSGACPCNALKGHFAMIAEPNT